MLLFARIIYFLITKLTAVRESVLTALSSRVDDSSDLTFVLRRPQAPAPAEEEEERALTNSVLLFTSWVICRERIPGIMMKDLAAAGVCGYLDSALTPVRHSSRVPAFATQNMWVCARACVVCACLRVRGDVFCCLTFYFF